jgi:hypothetical protein
LNHVGSPLRTQRLSAAAQHRLARHGWENATIRRFRLSAILMPATSRARRAFPRFSSCCSHSTRRWQRRRGKPSRRL